MPTINIHITASNHARDGDLLPIDVASDLSLADLKAYISAETELDPSRQAFFLDGQPLTNDNITVEQAGIKEGDLLAVMVAGGEQSQGAQARQAPQSSSAQSDSASAGADQIELARQRFASDSNALAELRSQVPDLARAVQDPARFRQLYQQMQNQAQSQAAERARLIDAINDDPFDVEAQAKIEEMIRQERVMENLEYAHEHLPESFASVSMLYINASVNGHPIKVLVDSGAQMTVMTPACAEACNIMRLIDKRYAGIARGVGTAKILGKVHSAELQIGNNFLPCSFKVMEGKSVDLLLGLDMLKQYQVIIDLKKNKLVFPHEEVDFLPESEIPDFMAEEPTTETSTASPAVRSEVVRPADVLQKPDTGSNFQGPGNSLSGSSTQPGTSSSFTIPSQPVAGSTAQTVQQSTRYSKEAIDQLQSLGFDRNQAIAALDATDGDVDMAAGLLFS